MGFSSCVCTRCLSQAHAEVGSREHAVHKAKASTESLMTLSLHPFHSFSDNWSWLFQFVCYWGLPKQRTDGRSWVSTASLPWGTCSSSHRPRKNRLRSLQTLNSKSVHHKAVTNINESSVFSGLVNIVWSQCLEFVSTQPPSPKGSEEYSFQNIKVCCSNQNRDRLLRENATTDLLAFSGQTLPRFPSLRSIYGTWSSNDNVDTSKTTENCCGWFQ